MKKIDLNCDMGEGLGNEKQLMPLISSCNISCGAHAGDTNEINDTIKLALAHNVYIGAHPGYPDKKNFGRKVMDISATALQESIQNQMASFQFKLDKLNAELHHIKPHGALYNQIAIDAATAQLFLKAIHQFDSVPIYVPFGSEIAKHAKKEGFEIIYEAFLDRNYDAHLRLVPRQVKNALIVDPKEVLSHLLEMVMEQKVTSIEGNNLSLKAATFCIHGDTPSALKILMYLHNELPKYRLSIA